MEQVITKYGTLSDISFKECYADGSLKGVILSSPQSLNTPYGRLVPQYENDGVRRKFIDSLSFYPNGNLRSISLQQQTPIPTPLGIIPAEKITFYENGHIKRIFPLNGKISGFWTEANEYELAEAIAFELPFAGFSCKVIGIQFYGTGAVKSITFWPKEVVTLKTPVGPIRVRIGLSLHPDGSLASVEPFTPTLINTPIGQINAFDVNAVGIHADTNSLSFDPEGRLKTVVTSSDRITVKQKSGREITLEPALKPSLVFEGKMDILPLKVEFTETKVRFHSSRMVEVELAEAEIEVANLPLKHRHACSDCSGCDACG